MFTFGDQVFRVKPKLAMVASYSSLTFICCWINKTTKLFGQTKFIEEEDLKFIIPQRWLDVRGFAAPVQDGTTPPEQIILSNWNTVQFLIVMEDCQQMDQGFTENQKQTVHSSSLNKIASVGQIDWSQNSIVL